MSAISSSYPFLGTGVRAHGPSTFPQQPATPAPFGGREVRNYWLAHRHNEQIEVQQRNNLLNATLLRAYRFGG